MKNSIENLFDWSNKILKTDTRYLIKGGFWLTLAKILSSLAVLASSVAFANLLPEETYGVYRYVLSILALLSVFSLGGIDNALTIAVAQKKGISIKKILKEKILWGLLGGLTSLFIGLYYFFNDNLTLSTIFFLSAAFLPFLNPLHIYTATLNGLKKFKILAVNEVLARVITATSLIITVFFTNNIFIIILVYLISTTLPRLIFLKLNLRHKLPKEVAKDTKEVIKYGKHLSFMSTLGQVSLQLDKILLFHFLGATALATYYLVIVPAQQIQSIFGGLTTLAFPKFSTEKLANLRASLPMKLARMYILILPIITLYIFTAPFLFRVMFPLYQEAVFLSQIFILQLLFFPVTLLKTAITAQSQKKKLYIASFSYTLGRIFLLVILVPLFGMYGAVAALMGTMFIYSVTLLVLFFNDFKKPIK